MYASPLFRWPDFVLGMCLPHLSWSEEVAKTIDVLRLVDVTTLTLIAMPFFAGEFSSCLLNANAQFPLHCIMLWSFIGGKYERCSQTGNILTSQALQFLGSISYSFYLQQEFVLRIMGVWTGGNASPWEAVYSFQVICALVVLLPTAWAAVEFTENLPSKLVQQLTAPGDKR